MVHDNDCECLACTLMRMRESIQKMRAYPPVNLGWEYDPSCLCPMCQDERKKRVEATGTTRSMDALRDEMDREEGDLTFDRLGDFLRSFPPLNCRSFMIPISDSSIESLRCLPIPPKPVVMSPDDELAIRFLVYDALERSR